MIVLNILVDIGAKGDNFINMKIAQMIYKKRGIDFIGLVRLRLVSRYNRREEY
jgi:hypothetical protein